MRRRRLSPDERALWAKVRRSVRPIRRGRFRPASDAEVSPEGTAPVEDVAGEQEAVRPAARHRRRAGEGGTPSVPPLAALEPKARRRLARGAAEPEARLDLHGMRQASAYHALVAFLRQAQVRGARTVLVITGKGREAERDGGVLRHAVPRWLAEPRFRQMVVGFETAARRHGGEGAFYVRIRRSR